MKKQTIVSLFLLLVFSALLVGCGDTKEVSDENVQMQYTQMTTVELVESHTVVTKKQQEAVVTRETEQEVFIRSGVDALIEFANTNDEAMRLVIFGTDIDVWMQPNERIEVKFNTAPQVINYLFGDEYKQIIIN